MTTTPPDPDQPFGVNQPSYPGAQPQQPAPAYGSYPTDPSGAPQQRRPAPEQPASIALAVKLMLVGAALSVLSLVYSLTTLGGLKDDIAQQMRESDASVSQSTIDAAYGVAIVFAFLFGLVGAGLWVWMAWKNGQGRGWARVVATVFGGFNALGLVFSLGGNGDAISLVSSVISVVLAAVILVLLYRKESSEFYSATAASRQMH